MKSKGSVKPSNSYMALFYCAVPSVYTELTAMIISPTSGVTPHLIQPDRIYCGEGTSELNASL
jgi:hypothetical protein